MQRRTGGGHERSVLSLMRSQMGQLQGQVKAKLCGPGPSGQRAPPGERKIKAITLNDRGISASRKSQYIRRMIQVKFRWISTNIEVDLPWLENRFKKSRLN